MSIPRYNFNTYKLFLHSTFNIWHVLPDFREMNFNVDINEWHIWSENAGVQKFHNKDLSKKNEMFNVRFGKQNNVVIYLPLTWRGSIQQGTFKYQTEVKNAYWLSTKENILKSVNLILTNLSRSIHPSRFLYHSDPDTLVTDVQITDFQIERIFTDLWQTMSLDNR